MIPRRILVIQTAFIGDVILATALLENLHQGLPDAQIDFLVRKGNEGLFDNHPYLSNVLIWKKKDGKFKSLWQLLKQIRQTEYDWVINLQRFAGTGMLTAFSKAPKTTGFDKNPLSFLFTNKFPHKIENGVHEVTRNYELVKNEISGALLKPRLYPASGDYGFVKPYQSKPYICVAPASVWFTKQYPAERWIRLINQLTAQYQILLLGGPGDNDLAGTIQNQVSSKENVQNLCGKLSFLQSAALMQSSVMNFVNDSAPMHICSAVNASVTAVYCSTVPEFGFGPLSDDAHIVEVLEKLTCRPCGLHGHKTCPEGHFKCAVDIKTEQFLEVLP
ncbi:glycosyltransferase family 9 protein [Dyadobacter sp. LHD-138]|uniref:glycosyltransferase family 9 protein n=1 Tax=Dyadobacter sp. LHD-138 TaxID=3071413 RepID=UPI0027E203AD|nr:glycosyltransferase family 9 protein [Dyadobacter sp. LHD-138]MDQ6479634.1 glycosyltransferase family 9 protein [Dyadobacter sp. LHD-138]